MKLEARNEYCIDKKTIEKIVMVYKRDLLHPEFLAERFGYTAGTIQKHLKQHGIHDARDI